MFIQGCDSYVFLLQMNVEEMPRDSRAYRHQQHHLYATNRHLSDSVATTDSPVGLRRMSDYTSEHPDECKRKLKVEKRESRRLNKKAEKLPVFADTGNGNLVSSTGAETLEVTYGGATKETHRRTISCGDCGDTDVSVTFSFLHKSNRHSNLHMHITDPSVKRKYITFPRG